MKKLLLLLGICIVFFSCKRDFGASRIGISFNNDVFESISRGITDYENEKEVSLTVEIVLQEVDNHDFRIEESYDIPISRFPKTNNKYNYKAYFDKHPIIINKNIKQDRFYEGEITILFVTTFEEKTIFHGIIPKLSTERTKTQVEITDESYSDRIDSNLDFKIILKRNEENPNPRLNKIITTSIDSQQPLYMNNQDIQFEVFFESPDTNLEEKVGWPEVEFAIKEGNTFKPVTIGTREARNPISGPWTGFIIDQLQQNPSKGLYRIKVSFTTTEGITTSKFFYFSVEDYCWLPFDTDIFLYDYPSKKIHPSKFTGENGFKLNENQVTCSTSINVADFVYQNKNPEKNAYNIFYLDVNGNIRQFNCKSSGGNSGTDSVCYTSTSDNKFNKLYYDYETETLYALKTTDGTIAVFTTNNDIYSADLSFTERSYGNSFFTAAKNSIGKSEIQIQDFAICDGKVYMVTKTTDNNDTQFYISTGKILDGSIDYNTTMNIINSAKKNSSIYFVYEVHKELMDFTDILTFKNTNTGADTIYFLVKQSGAALEPYTYYMAGSNIPKPTYKMNIYSCGYALKAEITDSKISFEKEFGNNKTVRKITNSILDSSETGNDFIHDSDFLFYEIRNPVEDLKALYGPEKFIGIKNDTLYIADSGLLLRSVFTEKQYKNKRYVIPLSIDNLSLNKQNALTEYFKVYKDGGFAISGISVPFSTQAQIGTITFSATCPEDETEKEGSFIAG